MTTLQGTTGPLAADFDVAMLDLDGVVYVGDDAVPGVPAALERARAGGQRLAFVTNNASRTPEQVAQRLVGMGVAARPEEIITSAQAAARYLSDRLPPGSAVLVVGTTGLREALRERGLRPVERDAGDVAAVVQGFSPELGWTHLAEGSVAIRRGVPWVATNVDPTVPSARGPLPGNGSLVAALRLATGVVPTVTGKPDPTMHRETVLRTGAKRPLVVGDRLDTDIEGANAVGCPGLLVLSGVTSAADLLTAEPRLRPTYLAADAGGLLARHPQPVVEDGTATVGGWSVRRHAGGLMLSGPAGANADLGRRQPAGNTDDAALDALRALCTAAWDLPGGGSTAAAVPAASTPAPAAPAGGETHDDGPDRGPGGGVVGAADDRSRAMLDRLGLAG